jgi:hypothetical protein
MEETCMHTPHIHKMVENKNRWYLDHSKLMKKEIIDKYCHFCGMHGHVTRSGEFMAKLLLSKDSISKMDDKLKKKLQESFRNEQKKHCEECLKLKTKIIHELLDTGRSRVNIEAIFATILGTGNEE